MWCFVPVRLALVKANLVPQLIITLNPQSLPSTEGKNIHVHILTIIRTTIWLATPYGLAQLKIEDGNEQQAVHETVLKQVLMPSEQYICHLCVNRYSVIDGELSCEFMATLVKILQISQYYQPTMDFVLHMPVILIVPSSGRTCSSGRTTTISC
ncbi:hypothetical protein BLNAU_4798 [Blattamonas nauphoetae]|uniref:Uncharacterized protein n=1 Tax=Blattamonas nauphoetae TaxID=2049346 RepID=A0ABQ9Y964_9EUKA|nr:hypothetical protein BLNAU_4798 [Blattamonas nauphoetae]